MKLNIAISGMSCINGLGEGLNVWINALLAKRNVPIKINPEIFQDEIDKIQKGTYEMHRVQKIAVVTFLRALKSAGVTITKNNSNRIAVFLGNTYGVEEFKTSFYKTIKTTEPELTSPSLFPYTTPNSISASLSILLGIRGRNVTFSSGATSASEAILAACDVLSSRTADIVIVGGESFLCEDFSKEFYDCGFRQECCAAIVLERKQSVIDSGRKVYASIDKCSHGFLSNYINNNDRSNSSFYSEEKLVENIDKKGQNKGPDYLVVNQGNSFSDKQSTPGEWMRYDQRGKLFLSLEALFGNTFSASGIIGIILGWLLLDEKEISGIKQEKGNLQNILFMNMDSYGSYVSTVISKG